MPEPDDFDISPRDVVILKVRVEHPTVSTRELSSILDEEYDISLSHNRINEILRELSDAGAFRETILPAKEMFRHYLFRIAFHYPNFEDEWEECYWDLVDDPHVLLFFNADSDYHWQLITQFRSDEQMGRWIHEFFKTHGDLVSRFHNTQLHKVHKFQTDAAVFDDVLVETEEGRSYLEAHYDDLEREV
ncbi:MAG: helix-turn-helix domain-containing protein [Halarchaeum sp.]